jgi:aryl-alcohol dehydrogenase-like predicted oxidoreductase
MFAVRRTLSNPDKLTQLIRELIDKKQIDPADIDENDSLDFLIHEGGAIDMVDAAYRFCRYEPGVHVTLSGTGDLAHLQANLSSFSRPSLPPEDVLKLRHIFRRVDSVSGN